MPLNHRACVEQLAEREALIERAKTLWFNALFDHGTPRELHVLWYNEWLAALRAAPTPNP